MGVSINTVLSGSVSTLQAAIPAALAVISGIVGLIRINGRSGRVRAQIKDTLELAKLAEDAKAATAKERLDHLMVEQIDRLQRLEDRAARKTYDKSALGASVFLLVIGLPTATGLFYVDLLVTTILAWFVVAFLIIFVPTGIVMFLTNGDKKGASSSTASAAAE